MKNIGIILAGGSGSRVGGNIPKQYIIIAGKTVLEHTIERFDSHPSIDELVIVAAEKEIGHTRQLLSSSNIQKPYHITTGGKERYDSTLSALKLFEGEHCHVLIHDAARPLVSARIISDVIAALNECHAVDVAIPATDTIIETDQTHSQIYRIPNRHLLFQVQTPQGFDNFILDEAYRRALRDPDFVTTDDCSVVKKYMPEEKIRIVHGDTMNKKLTYPEDIVLFEYLLKNQITEKRG